jgi:hypothetical protein
MRKTISAVVLALIAITTISVGNIEHANANTIGGVRVPH